MSGCGCGGCGCGKDTAASDVIEIEPSSASAREAFASLADRLDDPLVRWRFVRDQSIDFVEIDGNSGWFWEREDDGEVRGWATVIGADADAVTRIIERLCATHDVVGVTVREQVFAGLPARLCLREVGHWCNWMLDPVDAPWMAERWTSDPDVVELDRADSRIDELLTHSDSAYIFSDDEHVDHWLGIERDGTLVAVGASKREASGAVHLVSICTHPSARGERLAERICRALMRLGFAEGAPVIYLEMHAENESGRRLYQRLGMKEAATYISSTIGTRVAATTAR